MTHSLPSGNGFIHVRIWIHNFTCQLTDPYLVIRLQALWPPASPLEGTDGILNRSPNGSTHTVLLGMVSILACPRLDIPAVLYEFNRTPLVGMHSLLCGAILPLLGVMVGVLFE